MRELSIPCVFNMGKKKTKIFGFWGFNANNNNNNNKKDEF